MRRFMTFIAAAAIAITATTLGEAQPASASASQTITITSGSATQFSWDGSTAWQPANVLTWGAAWPCDGGTWTDPLGSSSWVDFPGAADCGADRGSDQGFFRNSFTLPDGFTNASITISWLADNAAQAYVNGTLIDGNPVEDNSYWFFVTTAASSAASLFHAGTNQLTLNLEDLGGPAGLDFVATITYTPLPTTTAQCKDGGWQSYGIFKNQGDCVSYVATRGKNAPAR